VWAKIGVSVTADDTTAPDGNTTADLLTESAVDEGHRILQTFTTVSGTTYALSAYVKANGRDFAQIFLGGAYAPANSSANFDLVNSTVTQTGGGIISAGIEAVTQGFFRIHVTFEATASASGNSGVSLADSGAANYAASYPGDGTSGIYIWGAQLEEGSFPTSYIPTAGTQVTRAADDCVRTLGDEFNPSEGTLYYEGVVVDSSVGGENAFKNVLALYENTGNRLAILGTSSEVRVFDGSSFENVGVSLGAVGDPVRYALAYSGLTWRLVLNGAVVSNGTGNFDAQAFTTYSISQAQGGLLPALVKDTRLFPTALSDDELITLTGGN